MAVLLFSRANFTQMRESLWPNEGHTTVTGFGVAVVPALWAYYGWHETSYNAAEFRNPQRDLPKALVFGTLIVSATYLLANVAYYAVLTPLQVAQSPRVASTALAAILRKQRSIHSGGTHHGVNVWRSEWHDSFGSSYPLRDGSRPCIFSRGRNHQ